MTQPVLPRGGAQAGICLDPFDIDHHFTMASLATEEASLFSYTPLADPHTQLRLLRLHQDGQDEPVRCTLEIAHISHEYVCLSYMWGTDKESHPIFIKGKRFIVRDNLFAFLYQARTSQADTRRPLWIDAICINQQAIEEKNAQVALMGEIYKGASEVVAWLGEGDKDVENAFDFIALHGHGEHEHPEKARMIFTEDRISTNEYRDSLDIFSSLRYWSRMWTVQEVLLAKVLTIRYGFRQMPAYCVENINHFIALENMVPSQKRILSGRIPVHLTPMAITLKRRTVQRIHRLMSGRELRTSLFALFRKSHKYGCYHARDKIYALRALDSGPGKAMPVDYSADAATIMCDTMHHVESADPIVDGYRLLKLLCLSASQIRSQVRHDLQNKIWKGKVLYGSFGIVLSNFHEAKDEKQDSRIWTVYRAPKAMFSTFALTQFTGDTQDICTAPMLQDGDLIVRFLSLRIFIVFRIKTNTEYYGLIRELNQSWEQKVSSANESRREEIMETLRNNFDSGTSPRDWANDYEPVMVLTCHDSSIKSLETMDTTLSTSFNTNGLEFLRLRTCENGDLVKSLQNVRITRQSRGRALVALNWSSLLDFWTLLEQQPHLYEDIDDEVENPWR